MSMLFRGIINAPQFFFLGTITFRFVCTNDLVCTEVCAFSTRLHGHRPDLVRRNRKEDFINDLLKQTRCGNDMTYQHNIKIMNCYY